jgi:mono/diheme cytochrome c family protein
MYLIKSFRVLHLRIGNTIPLSVMNKTTTKMLSSKFYSRFRFPLIVALALGFSLQFGVLFAQDAPATEQAQPAAAAPAEAAPAGEDPAVAQGKAIFQANCAQCHAFNEVVVGPALKDAHKNWSSDAELATFIKYPQKVIDGGNKHAQELYNQFKQYMPNHDFLSDAEVNSLIAYIKAESAAPAPTPGGDSGPGVTTEGGAAAASAAGSEYLPIILGGLLVVLLLVLLVLVLMISVITKLIKDKEGELDEADREIVENKVNLGGVFKSNVFKGVVGFIFVIVLLKVGFDKVYAIGIQQGYAPKQPIAFSHKLHAGMYEIDCNYCHTGVNKGKSANIPSANICMNCHNSIKTESPEIKKIWAAIENDKPIEWIRVHNLPDLAYFNHAQHVNVGGLECQTCHGNIQEMEVVRQHSTLTMGWCINCHRETVVKTEGNAYYDKLVELHNSSNGQPMRVENIGGLECSRCHY